MDTLNLKLHTFRLGSQLHTVERALEALSLQLWEALRKAYIFRLTFVSCEINVLSEPK